MGFFRIEKFELLTLIFLAPFEIFFTISEFGTLSKLIGLGLFLTFLLRVAYTRRLYIPKEYYVFLLYFILCAFSILWAKNQNTALTRVLTTAQLLILYVIAFNIAKKENEIGTNNMCKYIMYYGFFLSVVLVYIMLSSQTITAWSRITIVEEIDVNHLASFLMPSFFIGLHFTITQSRLNLFFTVPLLMAIFLTQSRSAFIVIIIVSIVYLGFNLRCIKKINLLFLLIGFGVLFAIIPVEFFSRVLMMFEDTEVLLRASGRNEIWELAWGYFKENPIKGIGVGNFTFLHRPPHSLFFQIASELGLLGICIASFFLVVLFFSKGSKLQKNRSGWEFYSILALIFMALTVDIFYQKYFWIMLSMYSANK